MTDRHATPTEDQDALRRLYDGLADVVVEIAGAPDLRPGCAVLADFGVRHLGADLAGVSRMGRRAGLEVLAATEPAIIPLVGQLQIDTTPRPSTPPGADDAPLLDEHGLRSAHRIDLPELSSGTVALDLYSRTPAAFDTVTPEIAAHVAAVAGTALRDLERRTNLEGAVATRGVIGQAQGILMERYALTDEQAMHYLRRHSQETQQPVRDLATEIVGRRVVESLARFPHPDQ